MHRVWTTTRYLSSLALLAGVCWMAMVSNQRATAEETKAATSASAAGSEAKENVPAGHSIHGEAFSEGPRQKAYLMEGTGHVSFPVTTKSKQAQAFINQGVGQLHGFWYFEAERSFRQAAAIDPDCAIAYWGMAMANSGNEKRAKQFIDEAVKRKAGITPRESRYIDARKAYLDAGSSKKKQRAQAYVKALERILHENPEDLEAKAFLGLQLWLNRRAQIPISSYYAVDALHNDILAKQPLHPCHHFRIHLWDYERPEQALNSAALCGPSSPGIAHMWHMPGHIYSRLKRYHDAVWQQEASARVDHAHMMRDRVLPDQIHNFAHNNEWLIRNLIHIGQARRGLDLAKNMCELPRHPKYNTLAKRGSANYGRQRLLGVLLEFELWDELIALAETPYLEPTEIFGEQVKRTRYLGRAHFRQGDLAAGIPLLESLEAQRDEQVAARDKASDAAAAKLMPGGKDVKPAETKDAKKPLGKDASADEKKIKKARTDAAKPFNTKIQTLDRAINELRGHLSIACGWYESGLARLKKAGSEDRAYKARVQLLSGDAAAAEQTARSEVTSNPGELLPLACLVDILWQAGEKKEAADELKKLRETGGMFDLAAPPFARLAPVAAHAGLPTDWRVAYQPADDFGERPDLDSLGPFRWQPSPAPEWTLKDAQDKTFRLADYRGKPVIVIFYLGYGCLHCAEQLEAFAPKAEAFAKAGLDLVAISTDDRDGLKQSLKNYENGKFPFPLLTDAPMNVFKTYRAYDDFEQQPLHGTFLIDAEGRVRWHDISYEPFMDPDFVISEANRLLAQPATSRGTQNVAGEE